MFFDQAKIHVAAGNGGNGCVSFRREMHVPRGGPDGGDGGRGGDVILVGDPQLRDLQPFTFKVHYKAGAGVPGSGARKHGADGDDVLIPVPLGTQVWAVANSVSSEPMDTLTPGRKRVPRCRTKMVPALTTSPENALTPSLCALESRPFLELPPPFL